MNLADPSSVVLTPGQRAVLRVLAGTTRALTGREVASLAGLSPEGARKVLAAWERHGIAHVEPVARALLYRLNRDHLLAAPLMALLDARERVFQQLALAIEGWRSVPIHVGVFGSAARGSGGVDSDIDLLIIRPDSVDEDDEAWTGQMDMLAGTAYQWSGNRLEWLERSESAFARDVLTHERIVAELESDSMVLFGRDIRDLIRVSRK